METYKYQGKTYKAWSEMQCFTKYNDKTTNHPPHVWNGQYTIYGPYMCWGKPFQGPKHRKPYRGKAD